MELWRHPGNVHPRVLAFLESPQEGSNGGKINSAADRRGYVAVNVKSGRIVMVLGSPSHSILAPCGGLGGIKIRKNFISIVVQNGKHENVILLHPFCKIINFGV